jgi:hypothetical protein
MTRRRERDDNGAVDADTAVMPDGTSKAVPLADYQGKWAVLVFHPRVVC